MLYNTFINIFDVSLLPRVAFFLKHTVVKVFVQKFQVLKVNNDNVYICIFLYTENIIYK